MKMGEKEKEFLRAVAKGSLVGLLTGLFVTAATKDAKLAYISGVLAAGTSVFVDAVSKS